MMVQCSKNTVALASQTKLSQIKSFKACEINQIDILITDLDSNNSRLNDFKNLITY